MKLSKPVDPNDPVRSLKHWAEDLSAEQDGQSTLQYELIEALLGLRSQGIRDGWANWSGGSVEMLDLLRAHLPSGSQRDRILADLNEIQVSAETEGHFAYDEIDRLPADLLRWCIERPQWIRLPEGYQFWLDVPRDAVTPDAGRAISPLSRLVAGVRGLFCRKTAPRHE